MIRSELYDLGKFIGDLLEDVKSTDKYNDPNWVTEQERNIQAITAGLQEKWIIQLFSSAKDPVITRYIQFHQAGITVLSNQVFAHMNSIVTGIKINDAVFQIYKSVLDELEKLLSFVRWGFYHFFDDDYKLSAYNSYQCFDELLSIEKELRSYAVNSVDHSLFLAIADSITELSDQAKENGITYRVLDQVINLPKLLRQLLNGNERLTTDTVLKMLYRQNLNTLSFFNWYAADVSRKLIGVADKKKTEFLADEIRKLASVFVDANKAFEPELANIDEQLITWLRSKTPPEPNQHSQKPSKQNGNGHLPLNLSVPQFAVFIRVFYKNGCFATTNVAKITRFFVQHFTTKKQSQISYKSFSRAFYNLDQVPAAVVKDYLQKMLNYVNKTYFP